MNAASSTEDAIYPYIGRIRDALWCSAPRGRATVMIGAGFSRQAEPLGQSSEPFPLWSGLVKRLLTDLHLSPDTPLDALRVAQIYESTFGRPALDAAVAACVPDLAYSPGENHRRLLKLPWVDVLTTNYDTLLERAAADVFDRRYTRVVSPADLSIHVAPRVVKLHGTLPSHRPFIVTEEDYRCYPRTHAPFVNVVQQAVMETLVVLLGFSGHDPNFLQWIGWVRDELDEHAPPVYLCGVLDLSPAQQALFAARRVSPVDLGPLFPAAKYPDRDTRHAAATAWFLDVLAVGKPLRPREWAPIQPLPLVALTPAGPPVRQFTAFTDIWPSSNSPGSEEKIRRTINLWRSQRLEYPGWLVAPQISRDRVWNGTKYWREFIVNGSEQFTPQERMCVLRELTWRLDVCLMSLWTSEADLMCTLLESVNPFPSTLDLPGATVVDLGSGKDLSETWVELAFAIVRTAREDFDEPRHTSWLNRLLALSSVVPSIVSRVAAERAYWELAHLDLEKLATHLKSWRAIEQSPLGQAKLAAVYAELGETDRAMELASTALRAIRARLASLAPQLELLSIESWLIVLMNMLRFPTSFIEGESRDRLAVLSGEDCDPHALREKLESDLSNQDLPLKVEVSITHRFDPRSKSVSRRLPGNKWDFDEIVPAFVALRLPEVAPCAIRTRSVNFLSHVAANAALWLEPVAPFWAFGFFVRLGDKNVIERCLDRPAVAWMDSSRVDRLVPMLVRLADHALESMPLRDPKEQDTLDARMGNTALEILSRLAIRLSASRRQEVMRLLLHWLESDAAARAWGFDDEVGHLTHRLIFALPSDELLAAVVPLLSVPLVEDHGFGTRDHTRWPEVTDGFSKRKDWPAEQPKIPTELVARLTYAVRSDQRETRRRATVRLLFLLDRGWLSNAQVAEFGAAIWFKMQSANGLPTDLDDFGVDTLVRLPGAKDHDIPALVRFRLLSKPFHPLRDSTGVYSVDVVEQVSERLWDIQRWAGIFFPRAPWIVLTPEETATLASALVEWWVANEEVVVKQVTATRYNPFFRADQISNMIQGLLSVFGDVLLPSVVNEPDTAKAIHRTIERIRGAGFRATRSLVGLFVANRISADALAENLAVDLGSNDRDHIGYGAWCLLIWHRAYSTRLLAGPPPENLVQLLAHRIALRAEPASDEACQWMARLVHEAEEVLSPTIYELLVRGLAVLERTTDLVEWRKRYTRGEAKRNEANELLEIRACAVALASILARRAERMGEAIPVSISRWKDAAAADPLPEIRRAWDSPV